LFDKDCALKCIQSKAFSFASCREIVIPHKVEGLGPECFSFCESLTSVIFQRVPVLARMDLKAFHSCSSLKEIIIPRNVETIESECFSFCASLSSVSFEE
jgi:hypothetical protein